MATSKYLNNAVIIKSGRPVDKNDIELIQLYFENAKLSGGSDAISNRFESTTNCFHVEYKCNETKRDLVGQVKQFRNYTFTISDDLVGTMATRATKTIGKFLIIKNIDHNEDPTVIELYADYLVNNDNQIESIERSTIMENVVFVRYKFDFDMKNVWKRLNKRPKLRDTPIELYCAYETNVLLISLMGLDNDHEDLLDSIFNWTTQSCWQLVFKNNQNKFAFVKYKDIALFGGQLPFDFENCFNFDLIDAYIQDGIEAVGGKCLVHIDHVDIKSKYEMDADGETEAHVDNEFTLDFAIDDPFHDALTKLGPVFADFNRVLTACNARAIKAVDNDDNTEYTYIERLKAVADDNRESWISNLNKTIDDYWLHRMASKRIDYNVESTLLFDFLLKLGTQQATDEVYIQLRTDKNYINLVGFKAECLNMGERINTELQRLTSEQQSQAQAVEPVESGSIKPEYQPNGFDANNNNLSKSLKFTDHKQSVSFCLDESELLNGALLSCAHLLKKLNQSLEGCNSIAMQHRAKYVVYIKPINSVIFENSSNWKRVSQGVVNKFWNQRILSKRFALEKSFVEDVIGEKRLRQHLHNLADSGLHKIHCQFDANSFTVDVCGFKDDVLVHEKDFLANICRLTLDSSTTNTQPKYRPDLEPIDTNVSNGLLKCRFEKPDHGTMDNDQFQLFFEKHDFLNDSLWKKPKLLHAFNRYLSQANATCTKHNTNDKKRMCIKIRAFPSRAGTETWQANLEKIICQFTEAKYKRLRIPRQIRTVFLENLICRLSDEFDDVHARLVLERHIVPNDGKGCLIEIFGYVEHVQQYEMKVNDEIQMFIDGKRDGLAEKSDETAGSPPMVIDSVWTDHGQKFVDYKPSTLNDLKFKKDDVFYVALKHCKSIYAHFSASLQGANAVAVKDRTGIYIKCKMTNQCHMGTTPNDTWAPKVQRSVRNYLNRYMNISQVCIPERMRTDHIMTRFIDSMSQYVLANQAVLYVSYHMSSGFINLVGNTGVVLKAVDHFTSQLELFSV